MIIKELAVGPIMANCFIIGCEETHEAAVIDPGDEVNRILMTLAESKLKVTRIVNTHGHFDHVGGNKKLKEATSAELIIHQGDVPMLEHLSAAASSWGLSAENSPNPDRMVDDGDTIEFGKITLDVLHTPGHSPGGICLHTNGFVFVGDTLFAGSIGRTDLPGGNYNTLISSIKNKLLVLDDAVRVYPGHGPGTTIGRERSTNPFLR